MMKDQMEKELNNLEDKKNKIKERDSKAKNTIDELQGAISSMNYYTEDDIFTDFSEKMIKELKQLQGLNEFIKPHQHFTYLLFKGKRLKK
jgi:chromosome condensin MukBEF ATPase and DNA-binding subunit MukB